MNGRPLFAQRSARLIGLAVVFALALRLWLAWLPGDVLVQKTLPDDAFYYFSIARNVCLGRGVSVDGVTPTNGFHPLWAVSLLLPFAIRPGGDLPVHLGLSLAALFDVGAGWLAYQTARRLSGNQTAGLLAGGLYLFNPLVLMESLNGLETALSAFCFALAAFVYLTRIARQPQVRAGDWAWLGASIGLMLLARTDTVLFALVIGAYTLWHGRRRLARAVAGLSLAAAVAALLLAPWLAWNLVTFGSVVQSSAVAAPSVFRRALFEPLAQGVPFGQVWRNGFWPVIYLSLLLAFRYAGLAWTALLVGAILRRLLAQAGAQAKAAREESASARQAGPPHGARLPEEGAFYDRALLLPLLGAGLPLLVHTFIRWYPRTWYYVPLAWATALAVGPGLARVADGLRLQRRGRALAWGGLAALALVLALQGVKSWRAGFYAWQSGMLAGARWAATQAPADAVLASFNSGLQSYYGERAIVNLDGVVDWGALRAAEERSLLAYARQRGATHLVDYQAYLFGQFEPYLEPGFADCLTPVAELSPEFPPYGRVVAYQIQSDCP